MSYRNETAETEDLHREFHLTQFEEMHMRHRITRVVERLSMEILKASAAAVRREGDLPDHLLHDGDF